MTRFNSIHSGKKDNYQFDLDSRFPSGQACVCKGIQESTNKQVIVKMPLLEDDLDDKVGNNSQVIINELNVLKSFSDDRPPSIVDCIDEAYPISQENPFFIMEFLDGPTLSDAVNTFHNNIKRERQTLQDNIKKEAQTLQENTNRNGNTLSQHLFQLRMNAISNPTKLNVHDNGKKITVNTKEIPNVVERYVKEKQTEFENDVKRKQTEFKNDVKRKQTEFENDAKDKRKGYLKENSIKITEAVNYLHKKSIVHRDLKPNNIIIDKTRGPVLIDFGGIYSTDEFYKKYSAGLGLFTDGWTCQHQYAACEHQLSSKCDIFALGRVFLFIYTGIPVSNHTTTFLKEEIIKKNIETDKTFALFNDMLDLEHKKIDNIEDIITKLKEI